jgi:hemoglobin/transferrin/lactoferrin receptor protein
LLALAECTCTFADDKAAYTIIMKSIQKTALLLGLFFVANATFAQEDTTLNGNLDEVKVSALKFADKKKFVAASSEKINLNQARIAGNAGDLLLSSGALAVQKSQGGGGSPIIRGFEASRVLLMVDGIRMNNAIYRAGHLQNIVTVDPNVLDGIEVMYGPNSTLYGSDALGGVISMTTKNPTLNKEAKTKWSGNAMSRYATGANEIVGHVDVNVADDKWASLTSITYSSFGDITKGKNGLSEYPGFGERPFYVQRFEINRDSVVKNPDIHKQVFSGGFQQIDLLQKFLYKPNEHTSHMVNFQLSNSNDVNRYDRLTEVRNGLPRFAEWYYGPQKRIMGAYHFNNENTGGYFQQVKMVASYQNIEESRISRNFNSFNKDYRIEKVDVGGFTADIKHSDENYELHLGVDVQLNWVKSVAYRQNIATLVTNNNINTRYPDGDNSMHYFAAYFQHVWKISKHFTVNDGLRINTSSLKSTLTANNVLRLPFSDANQSNTAISGNLGLIYHPNNNLRTALLFSTGFRAPNVDDLAKIFESATGTLIVPNNNLSPEQTLNYEWNITYRKSKSFQVEASVWYTNFQNAIATLAFPSYPGGATVVYNGVASTVVANQNANKADVYGFSLGANAAINDFISASGRVSFTKGTLKKFDGTEVPLDHVPPVYGRVGVAAGKGKWNAELFALFTGKKDIADYNPDGEDNQIYATVDGMPGWWTLNFRSSFTVYKNMGVNFAIENILDRNYRTFASGTSAVGFNVVVGLRAAF